MKPRIKGLVAIIIFIILCASPTSTRAYIPCVHPQPPAKRYKVVKTFQAVVSHYIKPERKYYKSKKAYLDAINLNGKGEETVFGTKPEADFTIAANVNLSKSHLRRGKFERGTIVRIWEGDKIYVTGKIDDRCAAAEKLWAEKRKIQFDVFKKMSPKQAYELGKRKMKVEILQII